MDENRLDKPIADPETKSSEFDSDGFEMFKSYEGGFEFFSLEMTTQKLGQKFKIRRASRRYGKLCLGLGSVPN